MLKRMGIDGSGVQSVAMNRVGDKQKSFFKKSGTDEEHNLIRQNTPITSININFFVRSFVHLGYAREDDIRCIVCKIDGIESKSTRHHQVFKELLECSARKKIHFHTALLWEGSNEPYNRYRGRCHEKHNILF